MSKVRPVPAPTLMMAGDNSADRAKPGDDLAVIIVSLILAAFIIIGVVTSYHWLASKFQ